ncbi:MAG: saccharopine dehydrogenase NADP-binding domain-containing protein, partial [Candidatus Hodarchaeota archaeon]
MPNDEKRNFAVLGAGRQGTAAAYDLAKFSNADSILIGDIDLKAGQKAAARVNQLLKVDIVEADRVDVTQQDDLVEFLTKFNTFISAVPYYYNLKITKAAITAKAN